ncbi:efflux RND transporter periplasmic adaptor subunit [Thalassotalea psychrophila]|uniref:Efflux RND transporter periplasmic adaptor subunit n=1 Tax=Thalassotalea psychrophila TaxID=3065647 RepID=A0ABY9TYJ2_9GAMM|nr:efflux RND transporter periplasmic adaptor subunit [Colwelliaceae bacterium SQ149]
MSVMKFVVPSFAFLLLIGCSEPAEQVASKIAAPEVEVQEIALIEHGVSNRWPGKTQILDKAELSSQVRGIVIKNNFKEGSVVKRGDVLIEIDPEPILAKLATNKADVARAQIELDLAEKTFKASQRLVEEKVISELDADKIKADTDIAKVELLTAQSELLKTELRLKQAKIVSPIDGVVGLNDINIGEIIGPLKGNIIEVIANDKIEVYVLIDHKEHFQNMLVLKDKAPEEVRSIHIELPNGDVYEHEGLLDYIGTEASEESGYISYRVVFPNPDGLLVAGQNVYIIGRDIEKIHVIKIPMSAVQQDQAGRYVLIVNEANVAEKSYVDLGAVDASNVIITKGLNVGDTIITAGFLSVKVNQPVSVAK